MNQKIIIKNNPNYRQQAERVFENLDVAETTRQDYKYRIGMFVDFAATNGFNRNTFLEFKRSLASRTDYAISTKNKYLVAAKIFLRELNRTGRMPTDITQNVKSFSQSKRHKLDGLNNEEMKRVVERLQQLPSTPQTARLKAIIALLALQGLRQCECVRLNVKDLDLVAKTAMVRSKGQDDLEKIDLHPQTAQTLLEYLKSNKVADGPLFTSRSNSSRNHRLTTRALRQIVKNTFIDLGIEKTVHGFRHFFTTTLINTYKGDLLEVARYTRHKTLECLEIYNDNIKRKADLPRFYSTFEAIYF